MKMPKAVRAMGTAAVLLAACGTLDPNIQADGTVRLDPIEGGCWVIDAEGETYLPLNLTEEFAVDGLAIHFEATLESDMVSFCPGIIVDITSIQAIG